MTVAQSPSARVSWPGELSTKDKVRFLSIPASYPEAPKDVRVIETHMSWVFLAGERVYKLKKPVSYSFLDFSTLAAREANCQEEVRLNRRLAPDTYLGVNPLRIDLEGRLSLCGEGSVVDWLVVMRLLPDDRMLDHRLARRLVGQNEVDRVTAVLASFYRRTARADISPAAYVDRFRRQQIANREVLTRRDFAVDHGRVPTVLDRLDNALNGDRALLEERVSSERILDGHGDLRPEHICLVEPIVIFDCLEFNRDLRLVDPFDEISFLGMECEALGAAWVGPVLVQQLGDKLGERPPDRLLMFYRAFRAVLRARLALAHLLDPEPREPGKWEPLATRYLTIAEEALSGGLDSASTHKRRLSIEQEEPG
jgi:aminoglycoside phosphotransferase family enzyme